MDDRDLIVQYDGAAWVVARANPDGLGARFPAREQASLYACEVAIRLAPCWIRIYTVRGDLDIACHIR